MCMRLYADQITTLWQITSAAQNSHPRPLYIQWFETVDITFTLFHTVFFFLGENGKQLLIEVVVNSGKIFNKAQVDKQT